MLKTICTFLFIILPISSIEAIDYYTTLTEDDKDKSYLYAPVIKNHFFIKDDITNIDLLVLKLRKAKSPLSNLIASSLSKSTMKSIKEYDPQSKSQTKTMLTLSLVKDLNALIESKAIYLDKGILSTLNLTKTTAKLTEEAKSIDDDNRIMLNRMIINEAYPNEIAGWQQRQGKTWKRVIKRGELPYKYLQNIKIKPIKKQNTISFTVSKDGNSTWTMGINSFVYKRPTGLFFNLHSNEQDNEKKISLKASGRQIARRVYLNIKIETQNKDVKAWLNANIHLDINKDNGQIEKDQFVGFIRLETKNAPEHLLLTGRVQGNVEHSAISGVLTNIDGAKIGSFEGSISPQDLFLF